MTTSIGTGEKIKVFIVDSNSIVRQSLSQLINHEPDLVVIGDAVNGTGALKTLEVLRPDIVIIDYALGISGVDLIRKIQKGFPLLPILVVSMYEESLYAKDLLRAGAKGYLMKNESAENVIGAIRRLFKGEIYVSERMH